MALSSTKALASGGGQEAHWLDQFTFTDSGYPWQPVIRDIVTDSENSVYSVVYSDGPSGIETILTKHNSIGQQQWSKSLGGSNAEYSKCAIDSSDNVIVVLQFTTSVFKIVKMDSDGTVQWVKAVDGIFNFYPQIATDSSDNIIVAGRNGNAEIDGTDISVAKFDSSGSILWGRVIGTTGDEQPLSIAVDTSDNILVQSKDSGFNHRITKMTSSGTVSWTRQVPNGYYNGQVVTDASDNVIVCSSSNAETSTRDLSVHKFNSSGTLQWGKYFGTASSENLENKVASVDDFGNIYLISATSGKWNVFKVDSDGSVVFSKNLVGNIYGIPDAITIGRNRQVFVGGWYFNASYQQIALLVKLDPDGYGDGTYGNWTYADVAITTTASTQTISSISFTTVNYDTELSAATSTSSVTETARTYSSYDFEDITG